MDKQFKSKREEEVKNVVLGNVGTLITVGVGVGDANYLQHEYTPVFNEADLLNIDKYNVYIKTIVKNEPVVPFSMDVTKDIPLEKKMYNPKLAEAIRELSRLKYGRDVQLVESEIGTRSKL